MAAYDGEDVIGEQIESVLAQDHVPDEVVICDDCSRDRTYTIVQSYVSCGHPEFVVQRNPINLGFTQNFGRALSLCTGSIVFLCDQDDAWFPNKISSVVSAFQQNPEALLIVHDGEIVPADLSSTGVTKQGQARAGGFGEDSVISGALTAVRSELLELVLPIPNGVIGHDVWIHRVADLLGRRLVLRDVLQKVRRHGANISNWVGSSVHPINQFDVLRSQIGTPRAVSYSDRLTLNTSLVERFSEVMDVGHHLALNQTIPVILHRLQEEQKAILKREKILHKNFWMRKGLAIEMLMAGEYGHFNGYKSFMRDFCS